MIISSYNAATTTDLLSLQGRRVQRAMDDTAAAAVQELPFDALVEVLQRVGMSHRLTSCALVATSWAFAALKATIDLQGNISQQRLQGLQQWLTKTAAAVHSIQLQANRATGLFGLQLQLSALIESVSNPSALTQLCISNAAFLGEPAAVSLTALRSLPGLKELRLQQLTAHSYRNPENPASEGFVSLVAPVKLPGSALAALSCLTALQLDTGVSIVDESLQHLSCLTALKQLQLQWPGQGLTAAPLQQLSCLQQLTHCSFAGAAISFSCEETPALLKFTGLKHLALTACHGFQPALLTALTALQHFELCDTRVQGYDAGATALLAYITGLQHLTHLCIKWSLMNALPTSEAYTALTAPSQLQHLTLHDLVLRKDAWSFVLPADKQLTQLTAVSIATGGPGQPILQQGDLNRLVECCPNLQKLDVGRALHPYVDISRLSQLTGLRELSVSNVNTPWMREDVLVQLTGLQVLELCAPSNMTASGVTSLAPLQQLQRLVIAPHCADWSLGLGSDQLEFVNKV